MSSTWSHQERERFDGHLERVLGTLPRAVHDLLDESPLIVDDAPSDSMLRAMGLDPNEEDLCGLHTGVALTERSVTHSGELPDVIQIFRRGILDAAGGWTECCDENGEEYGGVARIEREIRITILHELGHHFGLSEADLERLGYG